MYTPYLFTCKTEVLPHPLQNDIDIYNPVLCNCAESVFFFSSKTVSKNLDPSEKMNLDVWDCSGQETPSYNQMSVIIRCLKLSAELRKRGDIEDNSKIYIFFISQ